MTQMPKFFVALVSASCVSASVVAYEINNHADMSQEATQKANLSTDVGTGSNGKLFRLGLKQLPVGDARQFFPLGAGLPPIPYCFGEFLPGGTFRQYELATTGGRVQDPAVAQPIGNKLTIAQLFRYGACFEDSETPDKKPLAHFYNPQNNGAGGIAGPSSLDWVLKRNPGSSTLTGVNHFTYIDARDYFYKAITQTTKIERDKNWGLTFQALGHIAHHLQDMGSPQHTRNDTHCNAGVCASLGVDRPSGYEYYFDSQFRTIRTLAATATAPMMFGLPREFWNVNTSDSLATTNPSAPVGGQGGMAAYTSTNFTSAGKNFYATQNPPSSAVQYQPTPGLPFPRPASTLTDVPVTQLFPAQSLNAVRARLCNGTLAGCKVQFIGTEQDPSARTASLSVFSQELLNPANTFVVKNSFTQNFFTYADAGTKLIPKAVEYSAGLINYFFRGEMAIRLPAEGLYGIIDGGNPASTCKDSCGFPKLKLRVKNTTSAINGVAQDMVGGTLVGVVKYSRNSCYTSDWLGDPGELNAYDGSKVTSCLLGGTSEPVEEQVISAVVSSSFSLAAGAEQQITLDFSAKPIPVNAWNIKVQLVFQGQLGLEPNAVAVTTLGISAPSVYRIINESNYLLINKHFYTRAQVNASQTLLSQVSPTSCLTGAVGSRALDPTCFTTTPFPTNWRIANGQTIATLTSLPVDSQAALLMLGDSDGTITGTSKGIGGIAAENTLGARAFYFDDAANTVFANLFYGYRGLQAAFVFYNDNEASIDTTQPDRAEIVGRPPLANPIPIQMTTFNF